MKKCIVCGEKLTGFARKYCSIKCHRKNDYKINKDRYVERARNWEKRNPEKSKKIRKKAMLKFRTEKRERFNELMRKSFRKNRNKFYSRYQTNKMLKKCKSNKIFPREVCKNCKSKENLEIHHEVYPRKWKEIRKAILRKKIYYLCSSCHKKIKK